MEKDSNELSSSNEILASLRMHLNQQRPVTLHNSYRGVPVSTEADVAMVHQDFVGLIVHPFQMVCIKDARYTFIESKSLPEMVRAYPVSIDYTNHVVLLKQLNFAHTITLDLFHSWVAPENPIAVDVQLKNGNQITADLLGMAVFEENRIRVALAVSPESPLLRGDKLSLSFKLVPEGDPLSVQGKVHSLIKIRNRDEKRLEVDGRVVMTDEVTILAYIAQREDQILSGLEKTFKRLRKGNKAKKR